MTKLKGILLTEGMHGMISQVEGLAKALDIEFIHEKIVINNFWKIIPPRFTPIKKFVFKNNLIKDFNIVISCGRKSVIPSIFLKKKYRNKIVNIHIQDPKVSLKNFDFIVVPEHDNLVGENVLQSKGAIHYLQENELEKSKDYLKSEIKKEKLVTLIMGGPNKYYDYNDEDIDKIFKKITKNKKYFISAKDLALTDALVKDGFSLPSYFKHNELTKKFEVPKNLIKLIENNQKAFLALKIVEIIGEDEPYQLDPETIYFVTNLLNKMNLVTIRNKVLNSALPLRT